MRVVSFDDYSRLAICEWDKRGIVKRDTFTYAELRPHIRSSSDHELKPL